MYLLFSCVLLSCTQSIFRAYYAPDVFLGARNVAVNQLKKKIPWPHEIYIQKRKPNNKVKYTMWAADIKMKKIWQIRGNWDCKGRKEGLDKKMADDM